MLGELPELLDLAEVIPVPFPRSPSHALGLPTWAELAHRLDEVTAREDLHGVVVTHGTNTLEETAYFLRLATNPRVPVLVTGAMRPWNVLGSDGPLNLWQAARYLTSGRARPGVTVGLNGRIWDPRFVTKLDAFRPEAIGSLTAGPLAKIDADGSVVDLGQPARGLAGRFGPLAAAVHWPRVEVVASFVGADEAQIEAAVAAGASGLVIAGLGPGAVTPAQDAAIDRAVAHGTVVCLSTRIPAPHVPVRSSTADRGILSSCRLSPQHARIVLLLALAGGITEPTVLQGLLEEEVRS